MRAREFFLLLLLLALGLTYSLYEKGELDLYLDLDGWSIFAFHQYEFEEETTITPPLPELMAIGNSHGEIQIVGTEEDNIRLRLTKIIPAPNEEKASEIAQKLHSVINKRGKEVEGEEGGEREELLISTNRDDLSRRSIRTNFLIFVPHHLRLDIKNSYGQVKITNVAEVTLQNSHGQVAVEDIMGKVKISNSYADVRAENIGEDLIVNSKHSEIEIKNANQTVLVNHSYGEVDLTDIRGPVTVEAHHCEVKAANIEGVCQIESSYRPIIISQSNGATISSRNSAIKIMQSQGPIEVNNSYGRLKIVDAQGDIKIKGKNLKVSIQDSKIENLYLSTSYRQIDLRNCEFSHQVELVTAHNSVSIAPAKILGPFNISGKYSQITFSWPENLKVPLRINNKGGKIIWELPSQPHSFISNGTSRLEAFLEEEAPGKVEINTSYGKVVISPPSGDQKDFLP